MWAFQNGQDLACILEEAFWDEFYITDRDTMYLLGVTHHEGLYAIGASESWLEHLSDADIVRDAIVRENLSVRALTVEEMYWIRSNIESKYTTPADQGLLWERFDDHMSRRCFDVYGKVCNYIEEYVGEDSVILFIDEPDNMFMWLLKDGQDFCRAFAEVFSYCKFYITEIETTYVLYVSHYNPLIGVGSCKSWLNQLNDQY